MEKMKQNNRKKFTLDIGIFLLITGALSNITIWVGAFVVTEAQGPVSVWVRNIFLPILGGISGLAMGITVAAGLVYVIARLSKMKPTIEHKVRGKDEYKTRINLRFYIAWGAIALLLVISPALLAPYVFMTITGAASLFSVLGEYWSGIWSVGRIVAADLATVAVAAVHGVHFDAIALGGTPRTAATTPKQSGERTKQSSRSATGTPESPANLRKCDVPGCEISYQWPHGKGSHFKNYHPDLVIRKGIPARVSLPIRNEKAEKS